MDYVEANGLRFGFLSEGAGPLVLLLHGFPDTAHTWDAALPALAARGFRAVAPFMRGYAPTAIPADGRYDNETLARDALALIPALGHRQAILVGHDWGASTAYSAAALDPARIRQLITLAIPHPKGVLPSPRLVWNLRHFLTLQLPGAVERARRDDFALLDELVRRWTPGWDVPEGETRAVKESLAQPGALDAALGYYRALRPWIPPLQKRRISVPTVSFAGEQDVIAPAAYERARRCFTGSYEIVRMPGGHFMHRQDPRRFVDELLRVVSLAPPET